MPIFTAERSSPESQSDNPIFQRHLFAYQQALPYIKGQVLEVGCGTGYGMNFLAPKAEKYTAIDKFEVPISLPANATFIQHNIPPFPFEDESFDVVVSFQVIEHIEDDALFVSELARVLKPDGIAIVTTPNILMSLTRNPWHVREYTIEQLETLMKRSFSSVEMKGIFGKEKAMGYFEENKKSVQKFTRFDIFDLQHRLPRRVLQIPYDLLNRVNRLVLRKGHQGLVQDITTSDFDLASAQVSCFDLFVSAKKLRS
jgi:2-polyprenyl-3-methyl-5-hydroxy-6-metoxy-1,4-benzoquinol methylase